MSWGSEMGLKRKVRVFEGNIFPLNKLHLVEFIGISPVVKDQGTISAMRYRNEIN